MEKTLLYNKDGTTKEAPDWIRSDRCGTCQFWGLLPEDDQPPTDGGVIGKCTRYCTRYGGCKTFQTEHCKLYKQRGDKK